MATGRTLNRWVEPTINGYPIAQETRSIGPLTTDFPADDDTAISDSVRGGLPGAPNISPGTINAILTGGAGSANYLMDNIAGLGASNHVLIEIGIRTRPTAGDPAFTGYFYRLGQGGEFTDPSGATTWTLPFGGWDAAQMKNFPKAWGTILRSRSQAGITAANSSTGIDDYGAATNYGGYMSYSAVGDGTATIKVQDAATNSDGSFADVTGLTTGSITLGAAASYGIVQTAVGATIRRYIRWQVVLGTATDVGLHLTLVRMHYG